MGICDRIIVMGNGEIRGELSREEFGSDRAPCCHCSEGCNEREDIKLNNTKCIDEPHQKGNSDPSQNSDYRRHMKISD